MSDSELYKEAQRAEDDKEIQHLLDKRVDYGWTQKDADRYNFLTNRGR